MADRNRGLLPGVAALIIVLSVMNGFQKEVRDRMLSAIAHVELMDAGGNALPDWHVLASQAKQDPAVGSEVLAAAPFVAVQSLLARGEDNLRIGCGAHGAVADGIGQLVK